MTKVSYENIIAFGTHVLLDMTMKFNPYFIICIMLVSQTHPHAYHIVRTSQWNIHTEMRCTILYNVCIDLEILRLPHVSNTPQIELSCQCNKIKIHRTCISMVQPSLVLVLLFLLHPGKTAR